MIVKHNLLAMNSNRMLNLTTSVQAKSTEKLSSGYKINRAADDAAGLAISEKMRRQVRGLTQASANAQDGISAVQTAEGALTEVHDMLQRLNELATKSANGTNSQEERDYIQSEVDALIDEIDRVSETTKFNEIYLLKGDPSGAAASGSEGPQKKTVAFKQETLDMMKGTITTVASKSAYAPGSADAVTADVAGAAAKLNFVATAYVTTDAGAAGGDDASAVEITADNMGTYFNIADDGTVTLKSADYKLWKATSGANAYQNPAIADVVTGTAKVDADEGDLSKYVEIGEDGKVKYKEGAVLYSAAAVEGTEFGSQLDNVKIAEDDLGTYFTADTNGVYTDAACTALLKESEISEYIDEYGNLKDGKKLYSKTTDGAATPTEIGAEQLDKFFDIKDAGGAAGGADVPAALEFKLHVGSEGGEAADEKALNNKITVKIEAMSAAGIGIKGLYGNQHDDPNTSSTNGVSTEESATAAIETIKAAIKKVSQQRSDLGAVQNRLEHTINNLDNIVENTQSAEAQIRDTDIATEMVKYANNNILQQAGTSMLSQANQQNQLALSLLG